MTDIKVTPEELAIVYTKSTGVTYKSKEMEPLADILNLAFAKLVTAMEHRFTNINEMLVGLTTEVVSEINSLKTKTPTPVTRTSGSRGTCYCGSSIWEGERCVVCGRT